MLQLLRERYLSAGHATRCCSFLPRRATLLAAALAAAIGVACAGTFPSVLGVGGPLPPDYSTPEASFVEADFNKLASEFIDEYANQYVVFEASYLTHEQGALLMRDMRSGIYSDLMVAALSSGGKSLQVVWSVDDRELGRPFVEAKSGTTHRVFAYVLPPHTAWGFKTRKDAYARGFRVPVLILIRATR
jgi:hypothetical protein